MIETYDKDEILRLQAQLREDNERELQSMKAFARKEGLEEGRAEGIKEGLAEGKAQGIKENSIMIAKNMLGMGLDITIISKATGLSEEEIIKLK